MNYTLDTNIIVDLLRRRDRELQQRYLEKSPQNYFVSEMVRAELLFGAALSNHPIVNTSDVEKFLHPLRLLPFSGEAAQHYAEIRLHLHRLGKPIGPNDLIIAATARAHSMILVTRNTAEFSRVPKLLLEEW
ncbi:MAG: type II toxin-antitoxin system VapC family toxin [Chthoniobacterales bacterium]